LAHGRALLIRQHLTEALGYTAGILRIVSLLPQIIKTFRSRKADDLSLPGWWMSLLTTALYLSYAALKGLKPLVITLSLVFLLVLVQIVGTVLYSTRQNTSRA
jgi:MtN3 and saliva related transmembrane protein